MNSPETTPLVSICIPTYNSAKYLPEMLDSIASQTYKNIEVIISDNASTDNTIDIIKAYEARFGWKLFENQTNIGAGDNFNRLISLAQGDYVAIYHADDVYHKDIVEKSVAAFLGNKEVGLVGTMAHIIDHKSQLIGKYMLPDKIKKIKKAVYDFNECMLGIIDYKRLPDNDYVLFFITSSMMTKREVFRDVGVFDATSFFSAVDYELWLRIAKRYKVAILNEPLLKYRMHCNQGSQKELRENQNIADIYLVLKKHKEKITDRSIARMCDKRMDRLILSGVVKQNRLRLFEKSQATLDMMSNRYLLLAKVSIRILNVMHIPVPRRGAKSAG